jgi:hypothetical protein
MTNDTVILEQLNRADDGRYSNDPISVRRAERTFDECQRELEKRGIAIRRNMSSGKWEMRGAQK